MHATGETPAGVYLHIPFCSAICPYCDFAVVTAKPPERATFVESLRREIELYRGATETFDTVYWGGGTPSSLEVEQLGGLWDTLRSTLSIRPETRMFMEVNPEDVTARSVRAWRELGVETLSLGVQSFDAGLLKFLGRRHSEREAVRAIEVAKEAGFATVSVDLIYALPGQTKGAWRSALDRAAALSVDHLSCYQITIHEDTPFGRRRARGRLSEVPDEEQAELLRDTHAYLGQLGYAAYEVSNFARSVEHQSRHNQKYWNHVPYLGVGPSAHSFDGRCRWWNVRSVSEYRRLVAADKKPVAGREDMGREELVLEALMLGLRTLSGVDLRAFQRRFGIDLLSENAARVEDLQRAGVLHPPTTHFALTVQGLAIADGIAASLHLPTTDGVPAP